MAKTWTEVQSSDQYMALDTTAQTAAKDQYFQSVVAPKVPKDKIDVARKQFFAEPIAPMKVDPTDGMSAMDRGLAGTGRAMTDFGRGVGQRLGMVSEDDVKQQRKLDAPLNATTAGKVGGFVGNVATALPTMMMPGANTVVGASALGALLGFLSPSESKSELQTNTAMGGIGAGLLTGGLRAIPALKSALVDPFTNKGAQRIAGRAVLGSAKDPQAVKGVQVDDFVPGSRRSLAETTRDPGVAQLQRSAMANSPDVATRFADQKVARNVSREGQIDQLSGNPAARPSLDSAREKQANQLYAKAFAEVLDPAKMKPNVAKSLAELTRRPSVMQAMKEAKDLALEEGKEIKVTESVMGLHYTKKALDQQIEALVGKGEAKRAAALNATKEKLMAVLDQASPAYKKARDAYAAASGPINKIDVADALKKSLFPPASRQGADFALTPTKFFAALEDTNKVASKALKFKGAKIDNIFSPAEMKALDSLGKDVGSGFWADNVARVPGSPTAQYLAGGNALSSLLGPIGIPPAITSSVIGKTISRPLSGIVKPAEENVQKHLADILADPEKAQAAFQMMKQGRLGKIASKSVAPLAVGTSQYLQQGQQ